MPPRRTDAHLRHATYYMLVAWNAQTLYQRGGAEATHGLTQFDTERQQIDASWAWVYQNRSDTSPIIAVLLHDYAQALAHISHMRYHPRTEHLPLLMGGLIGARRLSAWKSIIRFWVNIASVDHYLGDIPTARRLYTLLLLFTWILRQRNTHASLLNNLGVLYNDLGHVRRAAWFYRRALRLHRKSGNRQGEAHALTNLGRAYQEVGDVTRAQENYEQALVIARAIGGLPVEIAASNNLAAIREAAGDTDGANSLYHQQRAIAREIGYKRGESIALSNLAAIQEQKENIPQTIELHMQSLELSQSIGDRSGEATSSWNLGVMYVSLGDLARAIDYMQVSVDYLREIGHPDAEKDAAVVARLRQQIRESQASGAEQAPAPAPPPAAQPRGWLGRLRKRP